MKWCPDMVLDCALNAVAQADLMVLLPRCEPDFFMAMMIRLAETPITRADFWLLTPDEGGRQLSVSSADANVIEGGTATHVALLDTLNERVLYIATCPGSELVAGKVASVDSWAIQIGAPV